MENSNIVDTFDEKNCFELLGKVDVLDVEENELNFSALNEVIFGTSG